MGDLVSVIMSTYNEEPEWLKKCIDSILNQTYSHFEFLIVLDNPENVQLKELLDAYQKKDNRIKLIPNPKNMGLVKSLNTALEHCNGKYVARMDADDIADPERLEKEKRYLEEKNLDFVFSSMIVIDENDQKQYEWDNNAFTPEEIKKVMEIWNISLHPTWFLKREVYTSLGGYRDIPFSEDYDFSLRALSNGYKIGKLNENLLLYRMRSTGISKSNNFEQFIISRKLIQLYKKDKLNDYSYVKDAINKAQNQIKNGEKEKYSEAEDIFHQGVGQVKDGQYLNGISKLVKSLTLSKYHIRKFNELLKYKLLTKQMKHQ
ncbi:glycosyltransferase family 2 protein [Neobacillus niacini]|uniref:glycosyltransferase family 2 protein n=1 Tax=Neobacillus niacini TaxID=86668 RepID=UPI003983CEDC